MLKMKMFKFTQGDGKATITDIPDDQKEKAEELQAAMIEDLATSDEALMEKFFENGTLTEDERIYSLAIINVIAADGDILQTGYEPVGGFTGFELFEDPPFEKSIENRLAELIWVNDNALGCGFIGNCGGREWDQEEESAAFLGGAVQVDPATHQIDDA